MIYKLTWYRADNSKGNDYTVDENAYTDTDPLESVLEQWFGYGHIASVEVKGDLKSIRVYKDGWNIYNVRSQLNPKLSIKDKSELEI